MLIFVRLDIAAADIALFEKYEDQVLGLLSNHGANIVERLRSTDDKREVHLLYFPGKEAFDAFRADPARERLQELWLRCGASTNFTEVRRLREA